MQGSGGGYPPGGGYPGPGQGPPQPPHGGSPAGRRVEVQVSYAGRMGVSLAIAITILLFSAYAFFSYSNYVPDPSMPERPFPAPILVFPVLGLVFLIIPLTLLSEKARSPRFFDATGVTMRNGWHLPWQGFRGAHPIMKVTRSRSSYEVGLQLVFANGTAQIRYRPIVNKPEVFAITEALKRGQNPFAT